MQHFCHQKSCHIFVNNVRVSCDNATFQLFSFSPTFKSTIRKWLRANGVSSRLNFENLNLSDWACLCISLLNQIFKVPNSIFLSAVDLIYGFHYIEITDPKKSDKKNSYLGLLLYFALKQSEILIHHFYPYSSSFPSLLH